MTSFLRIVGATVFLATMALCFAGCEDSNAKSRNEVQAKINDAVKKMREFTATAFVPGSDEFNVARQQLDSVIKNLNSLNPADDGQKAARAMLTATAIKEQSTMDLAKAGALESSQSESRREVQTEVDAALGLHALVDGLKTINVEPDQQALAKEREASQQRLGELQQRLDQLAGPINVRKGKNSDDAKQVEQLKQQVASLRRMASEKGYADGFQSYEKAIETRRQADHIEYEIAQREMELGYSLEPDHQFADSQAKHMQSRSEALSKTSNELGAFAKSTTDNIAATKAKVGELSKDISDKLKALTSSASEQLAPLYEQAETALQKGASLAQQGGAGSPEDSTTGKLLRARILELQGRMAALRAQGLAEHKALLERLSAAGKSIEGIEDTKQALEAASTALTAATEQAKTALNDAMDAFSQINLRGDTSAIESLKKNLEAAIATLSGKPASTGAASPASSAAATGTGSDGTAAQPSMSHGDGFATPEELIEHVSSLRNGSMSMPVQLETLLPSIYAETPQGLQAKSLTMDLATGIKALEQAMNGKFGAEATKPALKMLQLDGAIPAMSIDKVASRSDSKIILNVVDKNGQPDTTVLRMVNGRWFIDGDEMSPKEVQEFPMMLKLVPVMKAAGLDVAQRIQSGELTTIEAAVQAFSMPVAKAAGAGTSAPPPGRR